MAIRIDPYDKSLVIDGWENGVADSPFQGISDMRNVNIISVPGQASVNFSTDSATLPSASGNLVSADAGSDVVTLGSITGTLTSTQCLVFTGASLPSGMSAATNYWVGDVSGVTCKLYTDPTLNTLVNIGGTGTGTFASINMGKPMHKAYNNDNPQYYIQDANGRVWGILSSYFVYLGNTTLTNAEGNGLIYYRGYLFAFRNAKIDYMNALTNAWTYAWATLLSSAGSGNTHYAIVAQDDVVYYCDGTSVGSFFQKVGQTFDPSSGATYTAAATALALPSTDKAQCLAELGINLLVGGKLNAIYPWNRTATSFTYPILLSETNIVRMVTVNTNTYVFVGNRGRIYITNGSQAQLYKKVPDHISGTVEPYFIWGDACFLKNQLYFGVKATTNGSSAISQYGGVWAIDLDTQALRLTSKLSYATYAGVSTVLIPIYTNSSGSSLYVGWDSGASTYGMDAPSGIPYRSSQATIDTDLIPIGTYAKPRQFERIEYRLSSPLTSGESISVKYRLDFSQSYTTIFTDTATSTNLPYSNSQPITFGNAQWVQFQIVLNSINSGTEPSYVRLREIRLTGLKE